MEKVKESFGPVRWLTVVLILAVIAIGELALHFLGEALGKELMTWPAFLCMVAFFLIEQNPKELLHIILGAIFGELNLIIFANGFLPLFNIPSGESTFVPTLIYILIFVGLIVLLKDIIPWVFNSFAFLFFLAIAIQAGVLKLGLGFSSVLANPEGSFKLDPATTHGIVEKVSEAVGVSNHVAEGFSRTSSMASISIEAMITTAIGGTLIILGCIAVAKIVRKFATDRAMKQAAAAKGE